MLMRIFIGLALIMHPLNTPLYVSSGQGHDNRMQMRLDRKARPTVEFLIETVHTILYTDGHDCRERRLEQHLAIWAAVLGHQAVTERCLDLGAENNTTNESGETTLHFAAKNGHLEIVKTHSGER